MHHPRLEQFTIARTRDLYLLAGCDVCRQNAGGKRAEQRKNIKAIREGGEGSHEGERVEEGQDEEGREGNRRGGRRGGADATRRESRESSHKPGKKSTARNEDEEEVKKEASVGGKRWIKAGDEELRGEEGVEARRDASMPLRSIGLNPTRALSPSCPSNVQDDEGCEEKRQRKRRSDGTRDKHGNDADEMTTERAFTTSL
ncbi:hypothetical protein K438DRAFT_1785186 [Mycena galopus ATCC 62051]|nr:hypothetical protein K438DRAFT_1785186 [Mycena galopus ATCC 62051]